MKRKLDLDTWNRKPHFEFFRHFEEPFYGVCVSVDCTAAYRFAKQNGISVFLYCVYQSLTAAHRTELFQYRIEQDHVFVHDQIDGAITVARSNGTFGYGHVLYHATLETFLIGANAEVERVRATTDLVPSGVDNVILFSALPWIDFVSLSHARLFSHADSRPRISFGKITERGDRRIMPLSIHVHHALIDGSDVGQYIDCFQDLMTDEL